MAVRSWLVAACFALIPALAQALTFPALPDGMCPLNKKIAEQAVVIDYLQVANAGSNEVLASFASCEELNAIANRKGNSIHHYGAVLRQSLGQKLPLQRKAYIEAAAVAFAGNKHLLETALTETREVAASSAKDSGITNPKVITADSKGVLFKNDAMLIIGVRQSSNFGKQTTNVASTAAMTLIDGDPISVNLYAPANDQNAFKNGSATLQPFVTKLIAANP